MLGKRKNDIDAAFDEWLDGVLKELDVDAVAYNVNIYENRDSFSAELVATSSFDKDDEDWACDEIYASRNDNNEFDFTADNWKKALKFVEKSVARYLDRGTYSAKLKSAQAVACGFVDGDLTVLFCK